MVLREENKLQPTESRIMKNDYLEHQLRDSGCIELRHQCGARWVSGLFDNLHALRLTIADLSGKGNLYTSINAPRLVQATNDMGSAALRDSDIGHYTRIVFDFDPIRPIGQPSTNGELSLALAARNNFVQAMRAVSWPMPATAMSGNGAHAMFRCLVPATPDFREMLSTLYRGLQAEFSTEQVLFDPTVRNPARIWRLYGSINRKGDPTAERPHRQAQIIIPDRWSSLDTQMVERLANRYEQQAKQHKETANARVQTPVRFGSHGDYRTLNVTAWFSSHQAYKRSLGKGRHAVRCPWVAEHSDNDTPTGTSTIVWDADPGLWPNFHCSHAHCAGRKIRDVMAIWPDADMYCASPWASDQKK